MIGEYSIDPLELLYVREVMRTKIFVLSADATLGEIVDSLRVEDHQEQRLLPVLNAFGQLTGILTRADVQARLEQGGNAALRLTVGEIARANPVEAFPDEPLRAAVYRMAERGVTRIPVTVSDSGKFLGLISLDDLLIARSRHQEEERRREQTLNLKWFRPGSKSVNASLR